VVQSLENIYIEIQFKIQKFSIYIKLKNNSVDEVTEFTYSRTSST